MWQIQNTSYTSASTCKTWGGRQYVEGICQLTVSLIYLILLILITLKHSLLFNPIHSQISIISVSSTVKIGAKYLFTDPPIFFFFHTHLEIRSYSRVVFENRKLNTELIEHLQPFPVRARLWWNWTGHFATQFTLAQYWCDFYLRATWDDIDSPTMLFTDQYGWIILSMVTHYQTLPGQQSGLKSVMLNWKPAG